MWIVNDQGHEQFGKEIDIALLRNGATGAAFTSKGIVLIDCEELFVEKVSRNDLPEWRKRKGLETADIRLLGDHRDFSGKRRLELQQAVTFMKNEPMEDFPIQGVRAAKELHESIADGANSLLTYHSERLRLSGVSKKSSAAHVHRSLCEALRLGHSYDQVDFSCLALGEHLCRWLIVTELAVERNPAMPDYSGLDIINGQAIMPEGRAATNRFQEWITSRLKDRSSIMKQERLFAQERRRRQGKSRGAQDDGDESDEGKGKKKKIKGKKDKKGGKGGAGEDAGAAGGSK